MSAIGFLMKRYTVSVQGHGEQSYIAVSPSKARADAWRDYSGLYDITFKDFLRASSVRRAYLDSPRFGEPITVLGKPAFWVGCNRQYIQFVYAGEHLVLNSHPYDVEPPEARRGTPYYEPEAT